METVNEKYIYTSHLEPAPQPVFRAMERLHALLTDRLQNKYVVTPKGLKWTSEAKRNLADENRWIIDITISDWDNEVHIYWEPSMSDEFERDGKRTILGLYLKQAVFNLGYPSFANLV
ncbi:hypothetical protein KKC97_02080 [bacterium]|nr:hypothetical protein [bacterium]MBU1636434.1 hypothetical protein [bacterium]